jgi:hypothetical protein
MQAWPQYVAWADKGDATHVAPGARRERLRPRAYPQRVVWILNNKIFISCFRWGAVLTEGSTSRSCQRGLAAGMHYDNG